MPKRIIRIDASAIKDSKCFRYLWLNAVEGWAEPKLSNDIHYGSCFHMFAEQMEITNGDAAVSLAAAHELWYSKENELHVKEKKEHLNIAHLTMACHFYAKARLSDSIFTSIEYLRNPIDNSPMVEQKFSIPLYEDAELLILLQGTIDGMAKIRGGCHVIPDWKTTSAYNPDDYFAGYKLTPQLKTYYFALDYYRENYPDSPIGRVLSDSKGQMGAFIFGAFLSSTKIVEFKRSELFWFTSEVMRVYKILLMELVAKIVKQVAANNGALPLAEGSFNGSCVTYTGFKCKYFTACAAEVQQGGSEALVQHVLSKNFAKREYLPLSFGGGDNKPKVTNEEKHIVS